jgi:DNA-binding NarL/FixJ family response regulator
MRARQIEYVGLAALQVRPYKPGLLCRPYVVQPPRDLPLLTTRQAQVVALVRAGIHSRKEIGFNMGWSVGGTKVRLCQLYRRLQGRGFRVDNMASLAIFAFEPEVLKQRT